ncbi:hypothetical protein Daura_22630 [Dactylosporangium aurantiacum]|uniref:Uncharacterized protein n=1 Tax=Dactylosporangium aurantiacum TaxID=35754 RepID=A0A9Q9IRQ6_9ACTN|nr:hypothetical protein [Dactylosporangium aurantiacum]MDG6107694.1 hypothetical protein [Dactylosporangium aurantiacum]UWZ58715.1 hypothetical protein Daura_22630 [Dactylosporangium aurantiacum]
MGRPDPEGAAVLNNLVARLRLRKAWAGDPFYTLITRRVSEVSDWPGTYSVSLFAEDIIGILHQLGTGAQEGAWRADGLRHQAL